MSWAASIVCELAGHKPRKRARWNHGLYFTQCRRCRRDLVREVSGEWHVPRGYRVVWRDAPLLLTQQAAGEDAKKAPSAEIERESVAASPALEAAKDQEAAVLEAEPIAAEPMEVAAKPEPEVEPDLAAEVEPTPASAGAEVVSLEWPFVRERRARPAEAAAVLPMPELDRRRSRPIWSWQIVDEPKASEKEAHQPAAAGSQAEELRVAEAAVEPPREQGEQSIMADEGETSMAAGAEPAPAAELEVSSTPQARPWRKRGGKKVKAAPVQEEEPAAEPVENIAQAIEAAAPAEEIHELVGQAGETNDCLIQTDEPSIVAETDQGGHSVVELTDEPPAQPSVSASAVRTKVDDEWDEFMADDSDAKAWEDLLRDPEPPAPVFTPDDFMNEELPAPRSGSGRI